MAVRTWHSSQPSPTSGTQGYPLRDPITRQTLHLYASNLILIKSLGRHYGFESLFYWQPSLFTKRHRSPDEQVEAEEISPFKQTIDGVYRRVRQSEALNNRPRFHDISALFDDLEAP